MDNLISVNKLADLLARDRRAVGRRLAALPVAEVRGRARLYRLADALAALAERGDGLDLAQERARLAAVQADRGELELAVRRGELIPEHEVRTAWTAMLGACRQRLLELPTRAAPLVADAAPAEAEIVLRDLVHEALAELRDDCLARAAACEHDDDDPPREGHAGKSGRTATASHRSATAAAGRKQKSPRGRTGFTTPAAPAPDGGPAARGEHRPSRAGDGKREDDQGTAVVPAAKAPGGTRRPPDR